LTDSGYVFGVCCEDHPEVLRHADKVYDVVIIMGGTNDLADRHIKVEEIIGNLDGLHRLSYATGARTVAITVPESNAQQATP
jgi:lysophospholipase L1-like esterase